MTFPKILWQIFKFVFRKYLLNAFAMVTPLSQYTFQFFIILKLYVKNAMQTILS